MAKSRQNFLLHNLSNVCFFYRKYFFASRTFHEAAFSKISVLFFNSQTLSSLFLSSIHFDYFCLFLQLRSTLWLPFLFFYFTCRFYYSLVILCKFEKNIPYRLFVYTLLYLSLRCSLREKYTFFGNTSFPLFLPSTTPSRTSRIPTTATARFISRVSSPRVTRPFVYRNKP